jgi:hypothetical protein
MKGLAAVLLGFVVTSVNAQKITGAEIIEYGVLQTIKSEGRLDAPNTVAGKSNNMIAAQLVENTSRVNASIGITFGILVKLLGEPEGAMITAHFRCIHPKLTDPVSVYTAETDDWESPRPIGVARYVSYTFDHDWEIRPGKWTIQVLSDGKVLAEKTFDVLAP